ncbi:MAG: LysR family transcriptional regulator [Hespellia sp.]|nr:LysR family transcriptional regulator [Hespellia sp.]
MNLYHLRYFVTLAHLEHYTKAAEILSITQPSLSHAISSLEKELGVKLFEKDGRNVVLTKCGQTFLTETEQSLALLDSSVEKLQLTGTGEGDIDIALLRTLSSNFVPKLVRDFLNARPDKKLNFRFHSSTGLTPDLIEGIKSREFDVAFCSKMEHEPTVEFIPVSSQELVLIVPNDHELASCDRINLRDTLQYPHVGFSKRSGLRSVIDNIFKECGGMPDYVYQIAEDEAVAGLVSQHFGIAVVPNMLILSSLPVKIIQIENTGWQRIFYMAYLKNVYQAPAIEEFKQFVIDHTDI